MLRLSDAHDRAQKQERKSETNDKAQKIVLPKSMHKVCDIRDYEFLRTT
jgi:hypothetical protein